ncbi:hypothetical protein Z517_06059 [Fonsecaea pedrosoi CBS 271.37]|uniref:Uncharacterized protein n=1 Tax=Fonsecaea pedrosoi CBS 271.37 TaxID=1442368 RepID=A0A0D2EYW2_9EURO|nr:uncharacterized protein Z517_06059 [Fonsecaea pedrosoi CBS 271.37]KIW79447.1 hypothetical protein Z517_06059 [Fonsecaea pedrosoi CBS 271.37]
MAGSCSESIINSVENFWTTEGNGLSNDENLKILTAGLNNMCSIAKCANDLIRDNPGLKEYLTYRRLVNVLDFVFKGAQSLKNNASKSGFSTEHLSNTIHGFEDVLNSLKSKLPQTDVAESTNNVPNSSAIELLLELFYKAIPEVPENIYEFMLAFEAKFGKHFTETNCCGLPRVVFICFLSDGMIITASAPQWSLSFKVPGQRKSKTQEKGWKKVNEHLKQMRRKRFGSFSKKARGKFAKLKAAWRECQGDCTKAMSSVLKRQHFRAFNHQGEQGGAFHVLKGAGSILKIYEPCIKCRHLYRFQYIGKKAIDDLHKDQILWAYNNCAEDLCHDLLVNDKASNRKSDESLC